MDARGRRIWRIWRAIGLAATAYSLGLNVGWGLEGWAWVWGLMTLAWLVVHVMESGDGC